MHIIHTNSLIEKMPLIVFCLCLLSIAMFYNAAVLSSDDTSLPAVTPDSYLYVQYASAIANGHPYKYHIDDSSTTGSTSHLYPFILAAFLAVGFEEPNLLGVMFWLNAIFFLLWGNLFWRLCNKMFPKTAPFIAVLACLNGHTVYAFLGLSDMGLFILLTTCLWLALSLGKHLRAGWFLSLCVFCRPEGMIITGCLILAFMIDKCFSSEPSTKKNIIPILVGITSAALVFLFNYLLTGHLVFDSIAQKGSFNRMPFLIALNVSIREAIHTFREIIFFSAANFRAYLGLSVLGGLLTLAGISSRWSTKNRFCFLESNWLLCALSVLLMSSSSGLGSIHLDRYFAWILPLLSMYTIVGLFALHSLFPIKHFVGLAIVLSQIINLVYLSTEYASSCLLTSTFKNFFVNVSNHIPENKSIGLLSYSGLQHFLPQNRIYNLYGTTTSAFSKNMHLGNSIEQIKHQPSLQFDYWILHDAHKEFVPESMIGEKFALQKNSLSYVDSMHLHKAAWPGFEAKTLSPLKPDIIKQIETLSMLANVDLGYLPEEASAKHSIYTDLPQTKTDPFIISDVVDGQRVVEVGRLVSGHNQLIVEAANHIPITCVLRATQKATIRANSFTLKRKSVIEVNDISTIYLSINDVDVGPIQIHFDDTSTIQEIVFEIPGEFITHNKNILKFSGLYMPLHFWFYQPVYP